MAKKKAKASPWTEQKKILQRWNYNVYRKMGYGADIARRMRNRTPETTLVHIQDEVSRQYERKIPGRLHKKDFPKLPSKAVTKKKRIESVEFIRDKMGLSHQEAARYNRLGPEKFLIMKHRLQGFVDFVVREGSVLNPKRVFSEADVLREIQKRMKKQTTDAFFKALRDFYKHQIGVPG